MTTEGSDGLCAYCNRDHEIHGGCFTGKKPSELRRVAGDATIPPALETLYRQHEAALDHIHDLYELDITNRMKAEGMGGTPHFKRRADNPAVYERADIQMGFIFFRRGYMTGLVAKVRSVEKTMPTPFHKPS